MKFNRAMDAVKRGKKVTRLDWQEPCKKRTEKTGRSRLDGVQFYLSNPHLLCCQLCYTSYTLFCLQSTRGSLHH